MNQYPHFLIVTFPVQGHLNPVLQFSKRLIRSTGARVTLATCVSAERRLIKSTFPEGLSFVTFSDGYDDGFKPGDDHDHYMATVKRLGTETLTELIETKRKEGNPFTGLVYTMLLPWAGEVARALDIPSAFLWIQAAIVFDIYYYYFNGYGEEFANSGDPCYGLKLPGLPLLRSRDLPSFFIPSDAYTFVLKTFKEQLAAVSEGSNTTILVNTFEELEPEALKALNNKLNLIPIGPLLPDACLDNNDHSDTSFGGDLFEASEDYMEWLDSQPKSSVVYVSFGSIAILSKQQMEEIARGLIDSGRPFLWVIRTDQLGKEKKEDGLSCREELEQLGKLIPWCSQVEVLSHTSLGCFVTHCGWNSTLEGLVLGVPMLAFPQWTDQGTNAKLIEDVWKVGVRVLTNEEGLVERGEILRCLDLVMGNGEFREELRSSAQRWRSLARVAVKEGGSSSTNLMAFVQEVGQRSKC